MTLELIDGVLFVAGALVGFLVELFFHRRASRDGRATQRALEARLDALRDALEGSQRAIQQHVETAGDAGGSAPMSASAAGGGGSSRERQIQALLDLFVARRRSEEALYGHAKSETVAEIARLEHEIEALRS